MGGRRLGWVGGGLGGVGYGEGRQPEVDYTFQ